MRDKHALLGEVLFEDVNQDLPSVQPFVRTARTVDVYICALGFEDRVLAIPTLMVDSQREEAYRVSKAICCTYTTNFQDNESRREKLEATLMQFCRGKAELFGDCPGDLARGLQKELSSVVPIAGPLRVMFDISAASGTMILSVMHALIDFASENPLLLTVAYSEPNEYFPSEESFQEVGEELVLEACGSGNGASLHEQGVSEVEINELYPGDSQENRQEYIIAIPSYRTERLARCLQRLTDEPLADPDKFIYWVLGAPPSEERHWRLELQKRVIHRLLGELVGGADTPGGRVLTHANHATASTFDYRQIMKLLFGLIDSNLGKNISVVHMGSKLQALGASLVLTARPEVTVCYAKPARYNAARYSQGIGPAWEVCFSNLGQVADAMRKVGTLRFISRIEPEREDLRSDWDPEYAAGA